MGVSRAELQAVKLERQGETEEAAKFRARAEELRYEDPYTALQDELDEAVKNEVCMCVHVCACVLRQLGEVLVAVVLCLPCCFSLLCCFRFGVACRVFSVWLC